jgi:oligoendopeptidase F
MFYRNQSPHSSDLSTQGEGNPSWDLTSIYTHFEDHKIDSDFFDAYRVIEEIKHSNKVLISGIENGDLQNSELAAEFTSLVTQTYLKVDKLITLADLFYHYASMHLSTDGNNSEAKALRIKALSLLTIIEEEKVPLKMALTRAPDAFLEQLLSIPEMKPFKFDVQRQRQVRENLLTLQEERLLASFSDSGHQAWGILYTSLASSIRCTLRVPEKAEQEVSLAEASQYLYGGNEPLRKAAWTAINKGWGQHRETCAAILNALADWRITEDKKRSHTKTVHFLDAALLENRLSRETLEAMFSVVAQAKELGQKFNRLRARILGKEKLDPWDLQAAPPARLNKATNQTYSFSEAIEIIKKPLQKIDPEFPQFIDTLCQKKWIETGTTGARSAGAYCVLLSHIGQTRVYIPFQGGLGHIKTLAHELGHAFHNSTVFDLPTIEQIYPNTLAETASMFMETTVLKDLISQEVDLSERLKMCWTEAEMATTNLLNIPSRFYFESKLYEQKNSKSYSPDELSTMMKNVWEEWYGDTLTQMDDMLWCSKLHFYKTYQRFYNFPYTFGYLFSLALVDLQEKKPEEFFPRFKDLLKNTGRMTVEELVSLHLGEDTTSTSFWQKSITILEKKADVFEQSIDAWLALNS